MLNDPYPKSIDESWSGIMQALAAYIISDLDEVQNSGELGKLLHHADPEIREAAVRIHDELRHFIVDLGKI